jgi:hypothetical protein
MNKEFFRGHYNLILICGESADHIANMRLFRQFMYQLANNKFR